jgi:predicted ABC-type ATPase
METMNKEINMRPVYIMLAGLPGSGKSFLKAAIDSRFVGDLVIVCSDDYIDVAAQMAGKTYSEMFQNTIKEAEKFMVSQRTQALANRHSVIHDQTNLGAASRSRKLRGVPDDYLKVCLYTVVDEDLRQARLLQRPGKIIPVHVDDQMLAAWQTPTLAEGFDDVAPGHCFNAILAPYLV